jgi:hypothetical protein
MNRETNARNDMYDVSKYTDQEIYAILELSEPTDRELEAKIISQITKYEKMDNAFGDKFVIFFNDIYRRFFDIEEEDYEEDEEGEYDGIEGFEGGDSAAADMAAAANQENGNNNSSSTGIGGGQQQQNTDVSTVSKSNTMTTSSASKGVNDGGGNPETAMVVSSNAKGGGGGADGNTAFNYSKSVDYSKGSLNPILKETIKRVISIDSQFRDKKVYPFSTDFTFNLSDVLQDVVSLKLYSVQIPFTWYTINNNYGANFFYIKGNSPGITNGNFDYKITIKSGNYSASDLIGAINASLKTVIASNPDVSFGNTGFYYDNNKINSTFTFFMRNNFNESYYYLDFPVWTSPQDPNFVEQTKSIPGFFGYNSDMYIPYSIYSTNYSSIDLTVTRFNVNVENATFYIYNYAGYGELIYTYDTSMSVFPNVSVNTIYDAIPVTLDLSGSYPRNTIIADLNSKLQNNAYLQSQSAMTIVDVSNVNSVFNQAFKMSVKMNRGTSSNNTNSKMAIVFPSGDSQLWVGGASCFNFTNKVYELNNVLSETPNLITTYYITTNPYIYFKCVKPYYGLPDTSKNDIYIPVQNSSASGYVLDAYLSAINSSMNVARGNLSSEGSYFSGSISIVNTFSTLNIGIQQAFSTPDFYIDVSNSILRTICNLDLSNGGQGFTTSPMIFHSEFSFLSSYNFDANPIVIKSVGSNYSYKSNDSVPDFNIYFTSRAVQSLTDFASVINAAFTNSTAYGVNLKNTFISFTQLTNGQVSCNLNVNVSSFVTETDYIAYLYDPSASISSWSGYLGFEDTSYNMVETSGNNYALVQGTKAISSNELALDICNNYFYIRTIPTNAGGVYTSDGSNDIKVLIDLQEGRYPRESVVDAINIALSNNPLTAGSSISTYNIPYVVNGETFYNNYSKIRLNINKTFTTSDYKVVFYDLYSFSHCNFGNNSSLQNVSPDSTLGWILGYRNFTEYEMLPENMTYNYSFDPPTTYYTTDANTYYYYDTSTNVAAFSGDTTISINLYSYFLIMLDDYTQNHLNDGLVTITTKDTSIPLPSYANKTMTRCDPITGDLYIGSGSSLKNNGLTSKQIYSVNQLLNNKNTEKSIYSPGPFVQDIFGMIPMKTAGLANGASYIEFGGTLQIQERTYFGPVNIHRMSIKLLNDKGGVVDLNGSNWSFSLIAEQLYNPSKS